MDWKWTGERRINRRRFLGAAGAAAAALGPAACSNGKKPAAGGRAPELPETPAPSRTAAASPTSPGRPGASPQSGENLRFGGYVAAPSKVYDPHKTLDPTFYGHQALVFSKLLAYVNQADGSMVADLAAAMPEQPDVKTYVFTLKAARWDDRAPLKGRPVTSKDVKVSIERQLNGDPSFVRKSSWLGIESIETPSDSQVVVKLKEPLANMLGQFAGVNSFIIPEEMAAQGWSLDTQLGSGPFRWVEWNDGKFASVGRNANWYGGGGRPYLNGLTVVQPKDTAEVEAKLRTKQLDAVFVGRTQADKLRTAVPELVEIPVGNALFYGMRFSVRQSPYTDQRFRTAVSVAIDRREMVQQFFQGSGDVNPWVSWPMKRWALPPAELSAMPGYRLGTGGREADIKEAKALLAAAAGSVKVPEDNPLFVPEDAEASIHLGSVISEQLARNLGLKVTVYPLPVVDLVRRMFNNDAPWVAGPDTGWLDLDDWLYPYFHSAGTKNTFSLRDSDMDTLIAAQRAELEEAKRRELGYQAQRKVMQVNAAINFVSERVITLTWPYVRSFPVDTTDGYQHRFADCWIDRNDPTFRGR